MSHSIARSLTVLALGGLSSLALVQGAQAATCTDAYGNAAPCVGSGSSTSQAAPGATVSETATGFRAESHAKADFRSTPIPLGTYTADATGAIHFSFKVPNVAPGLHHVVVTGVSPTGAAHIVSLPITVTGTPSGAGAAGGGTKNPGSGLPFTGFELGAASLLGAGLLGAGTVAVVSGRKRKTATT
jgi:hypothetical protein